MAARREAALRQARGHDAVACRHASVQRLDHAAHVFFHATCGRRRDAERMSSGVGVEAEQACGRRRSTECADRRCTVPAATVIVARVHHDAEPALQLESDDVGVEQMAQA